MHRFELTICVQIERQHVMSSESERSNLRLFCTSHFSRVEYNSNNIEAETSHYLLSELYLTRLKCRKS